MSDAADIIQNDLHTHLCQKTKASEIAAEKKHTIQMFSNAALAISFNLLEPASTNCLLFLHQLYI